ncbi:hypothetical protein AKAW_09767 [Aspergillus niger]|nr:hypothetical protein AKAW_09767 [Aspergillus niger]
MKLVYLGILQNAQAPAVELCAERDLSSYSRFTKGSVSEFMTMFTRQVGVPRCHISIASAAAPDRRSPTDFTFHVYARTQGIAGVIISDNEYPSLAAHQILSKMLDEFLSLNPNAASSRDPVPFPSLKTYIQAYQDPHQVDSILKIQKELDETKIVLHKTIESVLERGEKIDDLVSKSEGLSAQSKMFYTSAKKQNSCCVIIMDFDFPVHQSLPFAGHRSRLGDFLTADVMVAAGSAALVTPAVMILDRLVVEKSSHNQPMLPAFRRHLWLSITQPATFLTSRPSLLVWSLYTATFAAANATETILDQVYPHVDHAMAGVATFMSTFVVNSSVGIWKDVKFAQLFGHSNATPPTPAPKTTTSAAPSQSKILRSVSRTIPFATYSAFLVRDALTIFGSFSLPAMVSASIPDSIASSEYLKILFAQLAIPASIQLVSTPIHLLGLDLYNRPMQLSASDRLSRVSRDWIGASLTRMCRIIPAFGIGGFANTEGRAFLHQQLRRCED